MLAKRLKALRDRLFGILGRLLGHPVMIKLVVSVSGSLLLWMLKLAIIGLLSVVGISIPMN
jgi:hypothetical protein